MRQHLDLFVPLTAALRRAADDAAGYRVDSDEAARVVRRALVEVVQAWTAYGEWLARVDSGQWLADYQRRRRLAAHGRFRVGRRSQRKERVA